ncbi:MAG: MFS transporter [Clostridiales bacterium]|nr:MFS transporter [Clostridiales bacterium]
MFTALLIIIYISFISLGLPDALLGSAWPSMHVELNVPVSFAGIISMIISGGTIISSFFSHKLINKLGTGKVTAISVALTALALFGFSISKSFYFLCFWAIPYGFGAGCIDAALNNFVALHYKSRHMSWLHCFWGIGATTGPYIMGYYLSGGRTWNGGYRAISILQIVLTAILIFSLPLWKKANSQVSESKKENKSITIKELISLTRAKPALMAFFCYCALEQTAALWAASYMVMNRGIVAETAAKWASLFFLGITGGRFISGFITMKLKDKAMVRLGQSVASIGIIMLFLPLGNLTLILGLILMGLGCAPIYPSFIHATPDNFGKDLSQAIMGMQMASAYIGATFMPPFFGILAQNISIKVFPIFLIIIMTTMIVMAEKLNKINTKENSKSIFS